MKDFLIGAQLYSVRSLTQSAEGLAYTLSQIKKMGYNTVQLSGQSREIPDSQVADMLRENALACVVTHNGMGDFESGIEDLIARHKAWNCQYAGLGSMPEEYRASAEGFRAFAQKVNRIADRLAGEGLTFVYHNHSFEFARFDGVLGMDILFNEFNENAQFELDSYWIQGGGMDPVQWFKKADGRMDVAHFKDMAGTNTFNPHCRMTPVGSGNLDWKALIGACRDTGVKFVEVEQDNASDMDDPLSQMRISHDNLLAMGARF